MKKLSKAQERELDWIKKKSTSEEVENSIRHYERLKEENIEKYGKYADEHIERYKNGWVLVHSKNSRTFEVLAENGYIIYEKDDFRNCVPIDWVKLIK